MERLPAPLARRLTAYVLDWLISLAAAATLVIVAAMLLLVSSDLNRRDPPDWALYMAVLMITLWLPGWLLYTSLAWSWCGATVGMALAGVRVVSVHGVCPSVWRSASRASLLALFTIPALLVPWFVAGMASLGLTGPPQVVAPLAGLIAASAAALLSPMLSSSGSAWHDHLTGTRVVMAPARAGGH